jgi:hypothetical protein
MVRWTSLVLVLLAVATGAVQAADYERPLGPVQASTILPANIITGPHYRIENPVLSYGYMHHYTMASDFGPFEVTGDAALRKLIREVHAIASLRELKKGKEFAKAIAQAGEAPVEFSKHLITHPVDTLTGVPKGLFRLFSVAGTAVTTKHDPTEDSALESVLLMSARKREYAGQLGVDPYSSNKVLQKELNSVGWAAAAGGLTVSAAMAPFSGPGVMALKMTRFGNSLNDLLVKEPPARLRQINSKKLSDMGIAEDLKERYLDHPHFTPRHDTILVASLAALGQAQGRDSFLSYALSADDEVEANFFMQMAEIMRGYHETVAPITKVIALQPVVFAQANNGAVLIPFPLDHGVWGKRVSRLMPKLLVKAKDAGVSGTYAFWVTGTLSPMAREQFAKLGIKTVEHVNTRIEFMD